MTDLDDLVEFFQSIRERSQPLHIPAQQTWITHDMAPDQFCICPVCLNENIHVQSVLYHHPVFVDGEETRSRGTELIAAQNLPCGHWTTGFVYTRRSERIRAFHPAWKEEYGRG